MRNKNYAFRRLALEAKPQKTAIFQSAFTLVEIIVVVAIVSLLVTVAIVEGVKFKKQANESNCQANLKAISTAFEIYAACNGGVYAQQAEVDLQFLVDAKCLHQDLMGLGQIGNFRYIIASVKPAGYDIRAMAINSALADHNYQIVTGSLLRRTDTTSSQDTDFKTFN